MEHLNGNDLQSTGATKVFEALSHTPIMSVLKLDLSGNNLQLAGISKLKSSLRTISSLTNFNISGNNFGQEAAKEIASVLSHNGTCLLAAITYTNSWYGNNCEWTGYRTSTLKLLNLSGAGIQSEGGDYIAAVICHNTALHHLIVDNNDLKAAGISKDHKSFVTQCNSTDHIQYCLY